MIPGADYFGGDLAKSSIKECRNNLELQGVEFYEMDILNFKLDYSFDIIIANAVAVYFTWKEYKEAINNVFRNLTSGGSYIVFEWIHPFIHQDIQIFETTVTYPKGIRICFRPVSKVREVVINAGFSDCSFFPFELPFDIQMPGYDQEVVTYTVPTQDGSQMMFRGALYQPWCHMVANK